VSLSDNRIASDQVTVSSSGGSFADSSAAVGKMVTVSGLSLGGADAGNYTLANTTATTTATIMPRQLTVTADPESKVSGAADPTLTYQVTAGSLASGDTFSGTLSRQPGENVGTHAIGQGTLTAGGNYTLAYVGADLTISPASVSANVPATLVSGPGASASLPRSISGFLVTRKIGSRRLLFLQIIDALTGTVLLEIRSPFQPPRDRNITVFVQDTNGDGIADTILLEALRSGKKLRLSFTA
jgi:hypothetical protein